MGRTKSQHIIWNFVRWDLFLSSQNLCLISFDVLNSYRNVSENLNCKHLHIKPIHRETENSVRFLGKAVTLQKYAKLPQ